MVGWSLVSGKAVGVQDLAVAKRLMHRWGRIEWVVGNILSPEKVFFWGGGGGNHLTPHSFKCVPGQQVAPGIQVTFRWAQGTCRFWGELCTCFV